MVSSHYLKTADVVINILFYRQEDSRSMSASAALGWAVWRLLSPLPEQDVGSQCWKLQQSWERSVLVFR